jgi:hypothetical protein
MLGDRVGDPTDVSRVGSQVLHPDEEPDQNEEGKFSQVPSEVDPSFESRRKALVVHFRECSRLGGGGAHGTIQEDKLSFRIHLLKLIYKTREIGVKERFSLGKRT